MRSIAFILFLAFAWRSFAKVLTANHNGDAPDSVEKMLSRALKKLPLHRTDMDDVALRKPGHLAISRTNLPFRTRSDVNLGESASRWGGYRPQLHEKKLPGHGDMRLLSHGTLRHRHSRVVAKAAQFKQLLEFSEPETDVTVKLVGVMHYNPVSSELAVDTIEELAQKDKLGSVVIEMCDVRWNANMQANPILASNLRSEMTAACDAAERYERPVILGDQRINITVSRMQTAFQETLSDLSFPIQGWQRIARNITKTWEDGIIFWGENYLNAFAAVLDPKFLLGTPVSLFKYFLTYLAGYTAPTLVMLGMLRIIILADAHDIQNELTLVDYVGAAGFATLNSVAFGRILLKAIVQERNEILAKSILDQCRLYQTKTESIPHPKKTGRFPSAQQRPSDIIVAANSKKDQAAIPKEKDGKAVVAVLGMVHCNGIAKLLMERQVH